MLFKIIIFLIIISHHATAYRLYTICNRSETDEDVDENLSNDEHELVDIDATIGICQNHLNESRETKYCASFTYIFNPYAEITRRRDVVSVCIRCALCQSIGEEIKSIFDKIMLKAQHVEPDQIKQHIDEELNDNFCKHNFCIHDLRQCEGKTMIRRKTDCGTHVHTKQDGEWPKLLKDKCLLYVSQLNSDIKYNLFLRYKSGTLIIEDFLCRGYGVFRECDNLLLSTCTCGEADSASNNDGSFWSYCFFY